MRNYLLSAGLLLIFLTFSHQVVSQECIDGMAGEYPCLGINQTAFLPLEEIGDGFAVNDNWGWVSPNTGREYVLQGRTHGVSFIDITDPYNPVYLGNLAATSDFGNDVWRDIKVYQNHAFIVADVVPNGLQIFDLLQLDEVVNPPMEFSNTAHFTEITTAHNIAINEATGYAYLCGSFFRFLNIQNPLEPQLAGNFSDVGYVHDVQVVIYNGPDENYIGSEIAFASSEFSLSIVDVTDKSDPEMISVNEFENSSYIHQGWLTDDHRYFLLNDEGDEWMFEHNTRTYVWDLESLEEPEFVGYYEHPIAASDHNLYVMGDYAYLANYNGGLRILKLNDLTSLDIEEVAYFDVVPETDEIGFEGAWNAYPFFPSGNIVVSNMYHGVHILQPNFDHTSVGDVSQASAMEVYPVPASTALTIQSIPSSAYQLELFNMTGQIVLIEKIQSGSNSILLNIEGLPAGIYILKADSEFVRVVVD